MTDSRFSVAELLSPCPHSLFPLPLRVSDRMSGCTSDRSIALVSFSSFPDPSGGTKRLLVSSAQEISGAIRYPAPPEVRPAETEIKGDFQMANEENVPKAADEISEEDLKEVAGGMTVVEPVMMQKITNKTSSAGGGPVSGGWDIAANKES